METKVITKWLRDLTLRNLDGDIRYYKHDLEGILRRLTDSGATYCDITDGDVEFYIEKEESYEEAEKRFKSEVDADKTVRKFKFEQAKEMYFKYKSEFN